MNNPKLITTNKDYTLLTGIFNYINPDSWYIDHPNQNMLLKSGIVIKKGSIAGHPVIGHRPLHDNAPVLEGVPLLPELHSQRDDEKEVEALIKRNVMMNTQELTFILIQLIENPSYLWNNKSMKT
jgi:hypothetical protein